MNDSFPDNRLKPSLIDALSRVLSKTRHLSLGSEKYGLTYPKLSYPLDMKKAWITQTFGVNAVYYKPLLGHDGIDFGTAEYSPVMIGSERETITNLVLQTNSYGRHAWTIGENGDRYIYGHLREFQCSVGDKLERGQIFALSGGGLSDPYKGYSTGPHLHWEWRPSWASIANGYAGAVDQQPYCTFAGEVIPIPVPIPEPLFWMVVNTDGLRTRTSPKIIWNNLTGVSLKKGTAIPIYADNILEGRLWAKISANSEIYACIIENKLKHMEVKNA